MLTLGWERCSTAAAAEKPPWRATPTKLVIHSSRKPCGARSMSALGSADELVHEVGAKPDLLVVGAAQLDLGPDVLVPDLVPVLVEVDHRAGDVEERHHVLAVRRHRE